MLQESGRGDLPGLKQLQKSLARKAREMEDVVKIGRTHLMDATPLTLGQEFSGYAAQLEYGIRAVENTLPHLSELALGGTAVGTGLNIQRITTQQLLNILLSLQAFVVTAPNKFEALAAHDALVKHMVH